jgi:thiamine-phosphate pyrophosphorylase
MRGGLLRLLDANANRAVEGLRVCEDLARFALNAPSLFRRLRALRHDVGTAVRRLPVAPGTLVRARASTRDPGRRAATGSARSLEHLLMINLQRAKEALRALEEGARLLGPQHSRTFQRFRFRAYDLERDLVLHVAAVRHR